MPEINSSLPKNVKAFCRMFPPSARLCRFVNRRSGTLLDITPSLDLVNDNVPRVVGNPESAGVQYWLITPYGSGQAIIPVPKDGSMKVRYLTPSTTNQDVAVTVSPFPTSWILMPTSDSPTANSIVASSVPEGMFEEWTCLISWPHYNRFEGRMLDLWGGEAKPNQKVVIYPFEHRKQWQYWRVQFINWAEQESVPPVLPIDLPQASCNSVVGDDLSPHPGLQWV